MTIHILDAAGIIQTRSKVHGTPTTDGRTGEETAQTTITIATIVEEITRTAPTYPKGAEKPLQIGTGISLLRCDVVEQP